MSKIQVPSVSIPPTSSVHRTAKRRPRKSLQMSEQIVRSHLEFLPKSVISVSSLTKKFGIGYENARAIIAKLSREGVIESAPNGNLRYRPYRVPVKNSVENTTDTLWQQEFDFSRTGLRPGRQHTIADVSEWLNRGSEIFGQPLSLTLVSNR